LVRWRCLALFTCAALLLGVASPSHAQAPGDRDGDGLPDTWEMQFGLDPNTAADPYGALGDPDGDGISNAIELSAGSHPNGTFVRLFAEGATGTFFDTRLALFNADLTKSSRTLLRFLRHDGVTVPHFLTLLPGARVTIDVEALAGLESANFSTIVESDTTVVADRTMMWDDRHYGSHAETGVPRPSTTWYLTEGATHLNFNLFYLLQNPTGTPATVQVTYLLAGGAPLVKNYTVRQNSRMNIWVDAEDPLLAAADVSAIIQSNIPIVAERAMYADNGGLAFGAGHASSGLTSPATEWFLAEGATGDFFDLFVLIANPNAEPARLEVSFLLSDGKTVNRTYDVGPRRRFTIYIDSIRGLENVAVSTIIRSTNGVPVLVERAMYWPGPAYGADFWREGHSAAGVTSSAPRWALADGEQGGSDGTETYVLIANTSTFAGTALVTLYFEDGGTVARHVPLKASSRFTVRIGAVFPEALDRRFAVSVESQGNPAPQLVVERSMYSGSSMGLWAAGTASLGTVLEAGTLVPNPAAVTLRSTENQVFEQGARGTTLTFQRGSTDSALTVYYATGGTATPGNDYRTLTGSVTFPAGQHTVSVPVTVYEDTAAEPAETILVSLVEDPDYRIGAPALVTLNLQDNDTVSVPATDIDASRFLTQATFGPRLPEVQQLKAQGYDAWLTQQFGQPASSFLAYLDGLGREVTEDDLQEAWFQYAVTGADQLRQRVSNALIEIMVASNQNGLGGNAIALAAYMDILQRNAFGNFRTLLQDVTLSPAMGQYLSHLKNDKPGPRHDPDENYAREVLQLFTIGLHKLNIDGTPQRDQGNLIPTYDQSVVEGFANVFTGWTYYHEGPPKFYDAPANWRQPMRGIETRHSTSAKKLLNGVTLPAGQPMNEDLRQALDLIFNHPNVGPFISRQLIQRLVTSNPSPAYTGRVAAVFNNDGTGVRGNLRAVVRAILLDADARNVALADDQQFGHLREPMIRFVSVLRAFNATSGTGKFRVTNLQNEVGQAPLRSPSVFNFFEPDFAQPGPVAELGLYSPEFQISTERWVVSYANTIRRLVRSGYGSNEHQIKLNMTAEIALAGTPPALADRLNLLLLNGQMSSELRNTIVEALDSLRADQPDRRAWLALTLVLSSPEFVVQK